MAYGQPFEIHWHQLMPIVQGLFYEQSPEAARKAMQDVDCQRYPEFMEICQEVIDGKPLRPYYLDVNLAELRKEFPNVQIEWITFTGFEREIYATSNIFMSQVRAALASKPGL